MGFLKFNVESFVKPTDEVMAFVRRWDVNVMSSISNRWGCIKLCLAESRGVRVYAKSPDGPWL